MKRKFETYYTDHTIRFWFIAGIFVLTLSFVVTNRLPQNDTSKLSAYDRLPTATQQHNMDGMDMDHQLALKAKFNKTIVDITNNESMDLKKCNFALNAGMVQKGYTIQVPNLPKNKTNTMQYADFMRYGVKFDPNKQKVVSLTVMCNDKKYGGWKYFSNK